MKNELMNIGEIVAGTLIALAILLGLYINTAHTINPVQNATFRIAIIDTGYQGGEGLKVCSTGSVDLTTKRHGVSASPLNKYHGTKIAAIIAEELKNVDYCAVIYQVESIQGINPLDIATAAILASNDNIVAVNISLTGPTPDQNESAALWDLSQRARLFIAAGNQSANLTKNCSIFPACYRTPNTEVVGALTPIGYLRADYSNYGKQVVTNWQSGEVKWKGTTDYGTSYAAPRALSKYVLSLAASRVASH